MTLHLLTTYEDTEPDSRSVIGAPGKALYFARRPELRAVVPMPEDTHIPISKD